jgi:hypothetical protein
VEGSTALPPARLRAVLDAVAGREVTLAEIEDARLALLGAYRAAGFPYVAVAARLAPQADGRPALILAVTEGHVAALRLEGEEIGPASRQAMRFLEPVLHQRPLPAAALERALLLAGDIPGVTAQGVQQLVAGLLKLLVVHHRRDVGLSGYPGPFFSGQDAVGLGLCEIAVLNLTLKLDAAFLSVLIQQQDGGRRPLLYGRSQLALRL